MKAGDEENTHWFTWQTPGSNVSVVSLRTANKHVSDLKMLDSRWRPRVLRTNHKVWSLVSVLV